MSFYDISVMNYKRKKDKLYVKTIHGENIQMAFGRMEPGFISRHSHPQEQMGRVLSGVVKITIDDEAKMCPAGFTYHIPANVEHSFEVQSSRAAEIMDIFSPPKKENTAA